MDYGRRLSRCSTGVLLAVLVLAAGARVSHAGCNLIPAVQKSFPSTLGAIASPITAPGKVVTLRLNPQCDTGSPGFDVGTPSNNVVTITFEPPGGGATTDVGVTPVTVDDALTLHFTMPSTAAVLSPQGLAGPARIRVRRNPGSILVADIGPLFQPTSTCDREAETVFQQFTILPPANVVADLVSGAATQIRATLDGSGSILLPLDHLIVLPAGPNAPIARFLRANSGIAAFTSAPGVPVQIPDQSFVRSFTLDGRALPPLLRVSDDGADLYGTTDARESVIRVARTNGMGGSPIYDFTDRLFMGRGPVIIDKFTDGFTVSNGPAVPLDSLQSSTEVVAFARDEGVEGNLNSASGDPDTFDRVIEILEVGTGMTTTTGKAVLQSLTGLFLVPSLVTSGPLTAFLESEAAQNNADQNGDTDAFDGILRVYDAGGTELTSGFDLTGSNQRVIDGRDLAISGPLAFFRRPRTLDFVESQQDGVGGVNGLGGASDVAVSPDGRHVYVAGSADNAVAAFSRNPNSGALTFVEAKVNGVGGVSGLNGAAAVTISPDGQSVYVVGNADNAVAVFARNASTGQLTFVEAKVDGAGGVDGLQGVTDVAVSPDGEHVYAAGNAEFKIAHFSRNPMTGALTFGETVTTAHAPNGLMLSPDGRHLYSTGGNGGFSVNPPFIGFSRDSASGQLTQVFSDPNSFSEPAGFTAAISPDGAHVYFAGSALLPPSFILSAFALYERNPITGALAFETSVDDSTIPELFLASTVAVGPDGNHVYVNASSGVLVFSRERSTGSFTFLEADAVSAGAIAVSPGDGHVYGTGSSSVNVLANSGPFLEAFDTGTSMLRPGLGVTAQSAAVAAGRAGILSFEENGVLATDLNGDGDFTDRVAQLYDEAADTVTSLGVAASRIALSDQLVAVTVPEASQGNAQRNGDDDTLDDVLAVQALPLVGPPAPQNLGVAADAIAAAGGTVVFLTPESGEGPNGVGCGATVPAGGCDLNGDQDASDRALRFYDAADGIRETGRAAEDFVVGGALVAFRTSEAAQHGTDLNGDGDTADAVMFVYDTLNHVVIPTGQAAARCTLGGCDPFAPYKVKGDLVSFLTREADQGPAGFGCRATTPPGGCDLNGDGDGIDTVMQTFNIRTRERFVVDLGDGCESTQVTRFVTTYIDGTIVFVQQSEAELGQDLNGDGDMNDCAPLLVSDVDEDETFDDADTCVERANPDQLDADLDQLGNDCDPNPFCGDFVPAAPPVALSKASADCQKALGKAALIYLKKRAKAERSCLDKIAKGALAGDSIVLCQGSVAAGTQQPPLDEKTAMKYAKAALTFERMVTSRCSDADLAPLFACADTVNGLAGCVLPAYGAGAIAMAGLAYGSGGPITPAARACQSAVGKATVKYLTSVTKRMQDCLDKINRGALGGDPQAVCLGSLTPTGLASPGDATTATKLDKEEQKLRDRIAAKCDGGELALLSTCGADPVSAGDCLACTQWRNAVEVIRSTYGP